MGKITFRADEDLVERVERLDASKSEVMREALRAYLDEHEPARSGRGREPGRESADATLDELLAERVDAMLAERLEATGSGARGIDLTISLDGVQGANANTTASRGERPPAREAAAEAVPSDEPASGTAEGAVSCGQCGTELSQDHVYCPNCGEKATRRLFCECGDEIRSDWSFCPGCGRRTPAAEVLDGG